MNTDTNVSSALSIPELNITGPNGTAANSYHGIGSGTRREARATTAYSTYTPSSDQYRV